MEAKTRVGEEVVTRWEELKRSVKLVSEIAAAVDSDGCDVYFLNRPALKGVKKTRELDASLSIPPDGSTPLGKTLIQALRDKGYALAGDPQPEVRPTKRLLFLIATDGIPDEGAPAFVSILQKLPENVYVQLMPITNDPAVLKYMGEADDKV